MKILANVLAAVLFVLLVNGADLGAPLVARASAQGAAKGFGAAKGPGAFAKGGRVQDDAAAPADLPRWVDTHVHLRAPQPGAFGPAVVNAVSVMDRAGMRRMIIMPPPFPDDATRNSWDFDAIAPLIARNADRLSFLGGNRLNQIIANTPPDSVTPETRLRFEAEAAAVVKAGAVGFGEIGILHLSRFPGHPYQNSPADHPLLLLLADIAARERKVIDLHMDLYEHDAAPPSRYPSPPNPASVPSNVGSLEKLLAHNRAALFVLAHFGSDITGQWSVELARRLLSRNPNLHMSIKLRPPEGGNAAFAAQGVVKSDWKALLSEYPDRFIIGTDSFFAPPAANVTQFEPRALYDFLTDLPPEIRSRIAAGNAERLYRLSSSN